MARDASIGFNFIGKDVSVGKTLKEIGHSAEKTGGTFRRIGETAAGVFTGNLMTSALSGAKKLFDTFAVDGVKAAMEDAAAQQRLATTLKNTTGASVKQTKAVEDYISKISFATGVADDELRPSLDRLVRATRSVTQAQKLQSLALDISAGTGKSLQQVSEGLAKAHDGNLGALKRLGITLDANIIKNKDFNGAVLALSKTFAGQSAKQADTFDGKMKRLTVSFNEAKETVGGYILDALQPLATFAINKLIPAISKFADMIGKKLGPMFKDFVSWAKANLIPAFMQIAKFVQDNIQPAFQVVSEYLQKYLIPAFKEMWGFIKDHLIPGIVSILQPVFNGLKSAFETITKKIEENKESLTKLKDFLMAVAGFITDYVAPIVGKILGTAFSNLGTAIGVVIDVVGWLIDKFSGLIDFFSNLPENLGNVGKAIVNTLTWPFRTAFEWIAKAWNSTVGSLSFETPDWLPMGLGGKGWSMPKLPEKIPALAKGGVVTRPTTALIGEAGPEAVIPLNKAGGLGMTVNIHVAGSVVHERDLAVMVRDNIGQLMRRRGLNPSILGV